MVVPPDVDFDGGSRARRGVVVVKQVQAGVSLDHCLEIVRARNNSIDVEVGKCGNANSIAKVVGQTLAESTVELVRR